MINAHLFSYGDYFRLLNFHNLKLISSPSRDKFEMISRSGLGKWKIAMKIGVAGL